MQSAKGSKISIRLLKLAVSIVRRQNTLQVESALDCFEDEMRRAEALGLVKGVLHDRGESQQDQQSIRWATSCYFLVTKKLHELTEPKLKLSKCIAPSVCSCLLPRSTGRSSSGLIEVIGKWPLPPPAFTTCGHFLLPRQHEGGHLSACVQMTFRLQVHVDLKAPS